MTPAQYNIMALGIEVLNAMWDGMAKKYPQYHWVLHQPLQAPDSAVWVVRVDAYPRTFVGDPVKAQLSLSHVELFQHGSEVKFWEAQATHLLEMITKAIVSQLTSFHVPISNKTGSVPDPPTGGESMASEVLTALDQISTSCSELSSTLPLTSSWQDTAGMETIQSKSNPTLSNWPEWVTTTYATDLFKADPLLKWLQNEPGNSSKPSAGVKAPHNGSSKSKATLKSFIENGLV